MSIAYENNTDLAFDTSVLRSCATSYQTIAGELRTKVQELDELLDDLKSEGWTTPAGTAFHQMVNTSWSENIELYASLLETYESVLKSAASQYESLSSNYIEKIKV